METPSHELVPACEGFPDPRRERLGALWVGTFDQGVWRIAGDSAQEVRGLEGRERFVNALAQADGLVWAGTQLGANWATIRDVLKPFDTLILIGCVGFAAILLWWRLGMPGRPRRSSDPAAR